MINRCTSLTLAVKPLLLYSVCYRAFLIQIKMEYTKEQIEEMKKKADKWDALGAKIEKCYCNADGEYDEENPEIEDADLCTIGEMAASAFGWL